LLTFVTRKWKQRKQRKQFQYRSSSERQFEENASLAPFTATRGPQLPFSANQEPVSKWSRVDQDERRTVRPRLALDSRWQAVLKVSSTLSRMTPPKQRSANFRDITTVAERFEQTVQNFVTSYDPQLRPVVARIACSWAKKWSTLASPSLFPPAGDALNDFLGELHHQVYHKAYYAAHREHILQRQRINYAGRKAQQPPEPWPGSEP